MPTPTSSGSTPLPDQSVRGSTQGRPIMALFDLAGRRWSLRIIWELHRSDRSLTFRELRTACGEISSSVLTRRLHELADARIAAHAGDGYALTTIGEGLVASMQPLLEWSTTWQHELENHATPEVDG